MKYEHKKARINAGLDTISNVDYIAPHSFKESLFNLI